MELLSPHRIRVDLDGKAVLDLGAELANCDVIVEVRRAATTPGVSAYESLLRRLAGSMPDFSVPDQDRIGPDAPFA